MALYTMRVFSRRMYGTMDRLPMTPSESGASGIALNPGTVESKYPKRVGNRWWKYLLNWPAPQERSKTKLDSPASAASPAAIHGPRADELIEGKVKLPRF